MAHPYIPNDAEEIRRRMLSTVGVDDVEELFSDIPGEARLKGPLKLPKPLSEVEVIGEVYRTLGRNRTVREITSFLGGGVWPHFVPSAVDAVAERAEFLTSYTPYQPEINQGLLQALFEYQGLICELVEMDAANCSMYDWATSLGEAARMASRVTGRAGFVVPHFIHPERLATLRSYSEPAGIRVSEVAQVMEDGQLDIEDLKKRVSPDTAGVYVENPSYLGPLVESMEEISEIAHDAGALFIIGVDPTSLGIMRPPGAYGADIVIGEGQPLGNPMNLGGPLLGIFACRGETRLLRQMPGRVVGMTTTVDGRERGFCLTLQTREQHIRRERATSNICTNEAHCALRAAVYMALMGGEGLRRLGEAILSMSHYAMRLLAGVDGVRVPFFRAHHFKEFTVNFDGRGVGVGEVNRRLLQHHIMGGKPIDREFPELGGTSLYCVTELHTRDQIDALYESLRSILEG